MVVLHTGYCCAETAVLWACIKRRVLCAAGEERFIGMLPTFHTFGMFLYVFKSLLTGASTMLLPRFEPELFVSAMNKFRVGNVKTAVQRKLRVKLWCKSSTQHLPLE